MTKKVLAFGAFDGLHEGHKSFLKQARAQGDFLTVVIARDQTVEKLKGHMPKFNEEQRQDAVIASGLADKVRLGNKAPVGEKLDPYQAVWEEMPDIIALGYDQIHFVGSLESKIKEKGLHIEIRRMEAFEPEKYHSSLLNK